MFNLIEAQYNQNGASVNTNNMGMREMQQRAYEKYAQQYILLKAPPASGKSRALMFIALEKLKQGMVKKVIVAVPEKSIGKSFGTTALKANGFHSDWNPNPKYDLCAPGADASLTNILIRFLQDDSEDAKILICTHSTLRFAYAKIGNQSFNDVLLAIDEFHHVSAEADNKLGNLIRDIMANTNAHVLAMTGSYFRGDCTAVLSPLDEYKFRHGRVTYNYYEQLNGYQYLKSLGIGFHFYQEGYLNSIKDVLNLDEKTIIYIPNVNSAESTKEKLYEVDQLVDIIGTFDHVDENNIYHIITSTGKELKVADLVTPGSDRDKVQNYLRHMKNVDDIDIIIALGMAKEGFDWKYCQTTLTVGYRGSLTEIVQIIGRCTRDSENKTHAQFTNLIAEPDAEREQVTHCINDILKAISASLLMEEVVAPKYNFTPKTNEDGTNTDEPVINISGYRPIKSQAVKDIVDNDLVDLKARIYQNPNIQGAMMGAVPPETLTKHLIPKVIEELYSDLSRDEVKQLSDYIVVDSFLNAVRGTEKSSDPASESEESLNKKIIKFASLLNVADLNMDLIYSINPFNQAYEIISKQLDAKVFKAIQNTIRAMKIDITEEEALDNWPLINEFFSKFGREPNLDSIDPFEKRLAESLCFLKNLTQSTK